MDSPIVSIEQIRIAFEQRQPDAMDRAERLRSSLVHEAMSAMKTAEVQQAAIEQGKETHARKSDTRMIGYEFTDIITASDRNLTRAMTLTAQASLVSDLIEKYGKRRLRDGIAEPGPTTEQLFHIKHSRKGDPIARLRALEKITDDHVRTMGEIFQLVSFITKGLGSSTSKLPVKSDHYDDPSASSRTETWIEMMERLAFLHAKVFRPWSQRNKTEVNLVLGLAVEGESLRALCRRFGISWGTGLNKLTKALDDYAHCRKHFMKTDRAIAGNPTQIPIRAS